MELFKSKKKGDQSEAWRLLHEAFNLFNPIIKQQHPQLLRYFFQQVYDYRLNAYP
jgi:hypothetical protein